MEAEKPYDVPTNRKKGLKALESLKYEPQVIIDLTPALITTAPEPVLSIREALKMPLSCDLA